MDDTDALPQQDTTEDRIMPMATAEEASDLSSVGYHAEISERGVLASPSAVGSEIGTLYSSPATPSTADLRRLRNLSTNKNFGSHSRKREKQINGGGIHSEVDHAAIAAGSERTLPGDRESDLPTPSLSTSLEDLTMPQSSVPITDSVLTVEVQTEAARQEVVQKAKRTQIFPKFNTFSNIKQLESYLFDLSRFELQEQADANLISCLNEVAKQESLLRVLEEQSLDLGQKIAVNNAVMLRLQGDLAALVKEVEQNDLQIKRIDFNLRTFSDRKARKPSVATTSDREDQGSFSDGKNETSDSEHSNVTDIETLAGIELYDKKGMLVANNSIYRGLVEEKQRSISSIRKELANLSTKKDQVESRKVALVTIVSAAEAALHKARHLATNDVVENLTLLAWKSKEVTSCRKSLERDFINYKSQAQYNANYNRLSQKLWRGAKLLLATVFAVSEIYIAVSIAPYALAKLNDIITPKRVGILLELGVQAFSEAKIALCNGGADLSNWLEVNQYFVGQNLFSQSFFLLKEFASSYAQYAAHYSSAFLLPSLGAIVSYVKSAETTTAISTVLKSIADHPVSTYIKEDGYNGVLTKVAQAMIGGGAMQVVLAAVRAPYYCATSNPRDDESEQKLTANLTRKTSSFVELVTRSSSEVVLYR